MGTASADEEIGFEQRGAVGVVTLRRPRALNALTHDMVRRLHRQLDLWEPDASIACVVVRSGDDRAFCAGGDIRALYELGIAGHHEEALSFWREEYALNCRIKRYPKPYVALVDGVVMGGGVGISLHGSHHVAGPGYAFAMPEVGIGFFPDVGATWALPRLPGHCGTWLSLTGARIDAADAVALGLAIDHVAGGCFDAVIDALAGGATVADALAPWCIEPGPAAVATHRPVIDRCFAPDRVEDVLAALDDMAAASPFAAEAASQIRVKSPTSLRIAREQMRRGAHLSFEEAMVLEFRIVSRIVRQPDFQEGVRAMIIDKDRRPQWRPATLDAVATADVEAYFAPLGPLDLQVAQERATA